MARRIRLGEGGSGRFFTRHQQLSSPAVLLPAPEPHSGMDRPEVMDHPGAGLSQREEVRQMAVRTQPQIGLEDEVLNDSDLQDLLERRQKAKEKASKIRADYTDLNEQAKGRILEMELDGRTVRCGRFLLGIRSSEAQAVSFERRGGRQASIRLVKEED